MLGADAARVRVATRFGTTADAFREFLRQGGLGGRINAELDALDSATVTALAACARASAAGSWTAPAPATAAVPDCSWKAWTRDAASRSPASSATAEDLPSPPLPGQQETFLNVRGEAACCTRCTKSTRHCTTIGHATACTRDSRTRSRALRGVQQMVRSDLGRRRHVHARHRFGIPRGRVITMPMDGKRSCRARSIRTSSMSTSPHARRTALDTAAGLGPRPSDWSRRSRLRERYAGGSVRGRARALSLSDAEVSAGAQALPLIEKTLRLAPWISNGRAMAPTGSCISCRRARRRFTAGWRTLNRYALRAVPRCRGGSRDRRPHRQWPRRICAQCRRHGQVQPGGSCRRHDRPGWEPVMKRAAAISPIRGGRTCHAASFARNWHPAVVARGRYRADRDGQR